MPYQIKLMDAEAVLTAVIRSRMQPKELSNFVTSSTKRRLGTLSAGIIAESGVGAGMIFHEN
jgi:hypothetical protein